MMMMTIMIENRLWWWWWWWKIDDDDASLMYFSADEWRCGVRCGRQSMHGESKSKIVNRTLGQLNTIVFVFDASSLQCGGVLVGPFDSPQHEVVAAASGCSSSCNDTHTLTCTSPPSARPHPSYGDCLEVKREYYQNCSVLGCVTVFTVSSTLMSSSYRSSRLGLSHWDPYAKHRGDCLEMYYCNMVEWCWWNSSLRLSARPTGFLQCFDTVSLVIWPVKIVSEMTYNVFSGMLSLYTTTTTHTHCSVVELCNVILVKAFNHLFSYFIRCCIFPSSVWLYSVPGKRGQNVFFLLSSMILLRFLWNLVDSFLNKFAAELFIMSLQYLVKLDMLIAHVLPLSCVREKLQNLSFFKAKFHWDQFFVTSSQQMLRGRRRLVTDLLRGSWACRQLVTWKLATSPTILRGS